MANSMKIAVVGAGAIGGLVAGYLKQKQAKIVLVGHLDAVNSISKNGLYIKGVRGELSFEIPVFAKLDFEPDLIIWATKSQDLEKAIKENLEFSKKALHLTAQNGVQADKIAAKYFSKEKIISSIVMFGATCLEPGKIIHNFEGSWVLGKAFVENDAQVDQVKEALLDIFPIVLNPNIKGMKYLKVFVNSNNCIPAILGKSMQEVFADVEVSRISMNIWKEGLVVVTQAGIKLESLPNFPLDRLMKLTGMPTVEAAKIFTGIMVNLSKEPMYGSILQSIKKNKLSEIDYINGEFVNIAKENKVSAPLNQKLVAMVHDVEKNGKFFSKEELLQEVNDYIK